MQSPATHLVGGPWWTFYPLLGIDITDPEPDLDSPIFGDCTIVSRRHVGRVVDWLYSNREVEAHDSQWQPEVLLWTLEHLAGSEYFNSILAVRCEDPLDITEPDESYLRVKSWARAREVGSCLGLVFLARAEHPETLSFVEQQRYTIRTYNLVNARTGYKLHWTADHVSQVGTPRPPSLEVTRAELLKIVQEEPYDDLCSILLDPAATGMPGALVRTVAESASRIIDALADRDPATSLLNSAIAIEILLRRDGSDAENHSVVQQRIRGLLGIEAADNYDRDFVFTDRHHTVHLGSELEGFFATPMRAIALAAACLFRYASAGLYLRNKAALVAYLDMIAASDNVRDAWTAGEKKAFDSLVRHKRDGVYFKWQARGQGEQQVTVKGAKK